MAGAVTAGSFECPAAAAGYVLAGGLQQASVSQDGAYGADGRCGEGVAVGVDSDDAVDVFCKHGHAVVLLRADGPWSTSAWVESLPGGTVMSHAGRRTSC
ncbi:hypothetical protein BIV23_34980 [Streptomyces monashensis]|uniref:Uncharacterized protein n=1 Tax=Streptomyces monashensis TaxID=1678012 RepID=A0A1S2PNH1_9ACTN|nr:hypothetical protein BIV23_34980 [Streptomyces monashensis]